MIINYINKIIYTTFYLYIYIHIYIFTYLHIYTQIFNFFISIKKVSINENG